MESKPSEFAALESRRVVITSETHERLVRSWSKYLYLQPAWARLLVGYVVALVIAVTHDLGSVVVVGLVVGVAMTAAVLFLGLRRSATTAAEKRFPVGAPVAVEYGPTAMRITSGSGIETVRYASLNPHIRRVDTGVFVRYRARDVLVLPQDVVSSSLEEALNVQRHPSVGVFRER